MSVVEAIGALPDILGRYVKETRALSGIPGTNEPTYYPNIRNLIQETLKAYRLPFEVRVGTSESKAKGVDMPDLVLGQQSLVSVYGEVKLPEVPIEQMAVSTENNDQIGRYLSATGVVLLSNVRSFGLLAVKPGASREKGVPVPPSERDLLKVVDVWATASSSGSKVDPVGAAEFAELLARAVTDFAPLGEPEDLAKVLARQARDAKAALPSDLTPIGALLDDFAQALGLSVDLEDPKGDRFFRGSLIQTAFYSLFAGWILWDREADGQAPFTLAAAEQHLHIPFLQELFHDLRSPHYLKKLDLAVHLERAVATLNRVDRGYFHSRMSFPTVDDSSPAVAAITYFYEPFLEAFDPELREELGVWYTPPEIVRYQVQRVHHLLKEDLGIERGLASSDVVVLDPCCGTGAYLLEVARCIAEQLRSEGAEDTLGLELLQALSSRVVGFEILTAPFAVAQLQLYVLLAELGVAAPGDTRLAVYLTNSLTGWSDFRDVKITFPEMKDEFDASQSIKQEAQIVVILGNPPYDGFAGTALAEEADLIAPYKGVQLQTVFKDGQPVRDRYGNPVKRQVGNSELYSVWGVRKQLLNDLYVRFYRLAEERIGIHAERGLVSLISNSSWLTGRSHPMMRQSLLRSFDEVWIDNLNGDKYKTGKVIPVGVPGAGTRDDSVFSTDRDPRGIQPGTAITTLLKRTGLKSAPSASPSTAKVHYREFWGVAADKRKKLLESLPAGEPPPQTDGVSYELIEPKMENRWRLSTHVFEGGYESWPALDELFPDMYQGVNHNRGVEGSVVDSAKSALADRLSKYFAADDFEEATKVAPQLALKRAGYVPETVWKKVRKDGFEPDKIKPFLVFPLDQRWLYYETEHKLLNRPRSELGAIVKDNEFLITVPEPRKATETRPLIASTLVNLHVHERGSVVIPREVVGPGMFAHRLANIPKPVWEILRAHYGLSGGREDQDAKDFVGRLFRVILAELSAPKYQEGHRSALSADWAHAPLPKSADLFDRLAISGERIVSLLDPQAAATSAINEILGGMENQLGQIRRLDGSQVQTSDLTVEVSYWGGSKGKWVAGNLVPSGVPAGLLPLGDLYLNDHTFLASVPAAVWQFQLGGYPVLKKWLGYRQADRRDGAPLSLDEAKWLRSMVQRLAALVALSPDLNALYLEAIDDAFTADAIGIER